MKINTMTYVHEILNYSGSYLLLKVNLSFVCLLNEKKNAIFNAIRKYI